MWKSDQPFKSHIEKPNELLTGLLHLSRKSYSYFDLVVCVSHSAHDMGLGIRQLWHWVECVLAIERVIAFEYPRMFAHETLFETLALYIGLEVKMILIELPVFWARYFEIVRVDFDLCWQRSLRRALLN